MRGACLTLLPSEVAVLTGDSGCGKTTLAAILCGIIPNAVSGKLSGQVEILGESILGQSIHHIAQKIGMVFQQADSQLIAQSVEEELAFAPENLCHARNDIRAAVDDMLARFSLEPLKDKDPARLSGGQKKLVTIAATLMLSPPLLILDEPMTGLDERGRALVFSAIEALKSQGKTLLVIEHDEKLFPSGASIHTMREGRL